MNAPLKRRLLYLVQISVGLVLIFWIMSQIDHQKFIDYFKNISAFNFLLILVLSAGSLVVQFKRWHYLIKQYSVNFEGGDLVPSFFAGFSFRLIIPGGSAEFSKIFMMSGKKRGKVMAFAMEKTFLTIIKILAVLIVLPLTFPAYMIYTIIFLVLLFIGYFLFPRIPLLKELKEREVNYHIVFGMNVLFSLGVLLIMTLQYYILLNQLDPISLSATLHTVVYLWSAGLVPISVSGLGVREGLAVYFFRLYGIAPAYAVATSLFLFTINAIVPALIGIFYIYKNRAHFREIKGSLKSTREIISGLLGNNKEPGAENPDPQREREGIDE